MSALAFCKFSEFARGTMFAILQDAYGFITCLNDAPIGFICWDPRHCPEYVELGHNAIITAQKGKGYGKLQLPEALRRIREYEGLREIRVITNRNLIARKNYESAGFTLRESWSNATESAFAGNDLLYKIPLMYAAARCGDRQPLL